ncbi:MAG: hypothetical protein H3C27_13540, partial [Opitutaceae bacterium]|nr:hypothetical protein [Opitutaceae bacterium]
MITVIHTIDVLEVCAQLVAYLVAWTIRAHRHLVRIDSEFIRVPNTYALEAAADRRWRDLDDAAAPILLHIYGGSPHGVHLPAEEMRRWMGALISGLGIAEGFGAVHYALGGRSDFHLVASNATLRGGPLFTPELRYRLRVLAQEATSQLNARLMAAGCLPIGCLTIEGLVYYPDLRVERIERIQPTARVTSLGLQVSPPPVPATSVDIPSPPPTVTPTAPADANPPVTPPAPSRPILTAPASVPTRPLPSTPPQTVPFDPPPAGAIGSTRSLPVHVRVHVKPAPATSVDSPPPPPTATPTQPVPTAPADANPPVMPPAPPRPIF